MNSDGEKISLKQLLSTRDEIEEFITYLKDLEKKENGIDLFLEKIYPQIDRSLLFKITDLIDIDEIKDLQAIDYEMSIFQKREPKVKNPYLPEKYTPIQILVKKRCKEDILYFAEQFYFITSLDKGFVKIRLRKYQKTMLELLARNNVTRKLKYFDPNNADIDAPPIYEVEVNFKNAKYSLFKTARQSGKSVISGIFMCWLTQFFEVKKIGVLANNSGLAKQILDNIKKGYEELPFWLKQGATVWNKSDVEFENKSSIKSSATTENAFTGFSLNVVFFDEVAKISPTIFQHLQNSLIPTLSSGTDSQIIYASTTFGKNHYFDLFKGALENVLSGGKSGNNIVPLEFTYLDIPERASEEWKIQQIKSLGGVENFAQEYMSKFLSVSGTLISGYYLANIQEEISIVDEYIVENLGEYAEYIKVYKKPIEGHLYCICVDPNESNGIRSANDTSEPDGIGIQIIDITNLEQGWEQVLTVDISGTAPIHYLELAPISYFLGKYFNNALLLFENNLAGKEIGLKVYDEYMYENVFSEKEGIYGYRLKQNKLLLCKMLKILIENNILKIKDEKTLLQLKTFIKRGHSYSAMNGYKDDIITPLLGAMLILLFTEDQIETYFPSDKNEFKLPNKLNILEEVYRLNPVKKEQFDTMCDLIFKIGEEVKSDWDKYFENQNGSFTIPYNTNYDSL